jgi:hypothetical protein
MIKGFKNFIGESETGDPKMFSSHKDALDDLLKLGLISKKDYTGELRRISQDFAPTDILAMTTPDARAALSSSEMKRLTDSGLILLSSKTQLQRGNLIIGRPSYDRQTDHALGFFPEIRKVRRMTPKGSRSGPYGWAQSTQDVTIKIFPSEWSDLEFYRHAMRWTADHVDLNDPEFRVKTRTAKGYFDAPLD